jgi:hypothetical protein
MIKDKIREAKQEYLSGAAVDPRNLSPKERYFIPGNKPEKVPLFTQRTLDSMIALSFTAGFLALGIALGLGLRTL